MITGEGYFEYLLYLVGADYIRRQCEVLHELPFEWWIELDGNLESDGKALRDNCEYEIGYTYDGENPIYATMFEVLVVLAKRMDATIGSRDDSPATAFGVLMRNLDIDYDTDEETIRAIVRDIVERNYDRFGHGGIFPNRRGLIDPAVTPLLDQLSLWCDQEKYII